MACRLDVAHERIQSSLCHCPYIINNVLTVFTFSYIVQRLYCTVNKIDIFMEMQILGSWHMYLLL